MSPSPLEYLRHILEEAEYLSSKAGLPTKDEFSRDETLKRAFVRSLEVIGEAAKKVPPAFGKFAGRPQAKCGGHRLR